MTLIATNPLCGLTSAEVNDRTARGEVNRPPRSRRADYGSLVTRNVLTPFNALVVPAAAALFVLGDLRGAWAVGAMATINTILGLAQEVRAKRHLDRLAILSESSARVVRDGIESTIKAGDVVRGDVICVSAGEPVVADGPVMSARFLEVDESLLTGESDPLPRNPGDLLLSGSFAAAGEGIYRAERVGLEAFAHHTTVAARDYQFRPGPLQNTLNVLIRALTAIALVLCGSYVVLYVIRDMPTTDLVQMVAATITSLVPQGLVLMATVALTLGAVRLTARGAAVQRLAAVEAMASVDVLCTDKTGTLTTNELTVDSIHIVAGDESTRRAALGLFVWATVDEGNRSIRALRSVLDKPDHAYAVVDQIPFQSQNRFSAVRVRTYQSERILVLGSLDALRARFDGEGIGPIEERFRELLPLGLRLLAFAEGMSPAFDGPLRPVALIALRDELRPDAPIVLQKLGGQGVRIVVLSGDHPETVRATISHLNVALDAGEIRTGAELDVAPDREILVAKTSIFGRVTPQQKKEIVRTLQRQGHRVAMIGDGVNDILVVKSADLGIAMGAGTSATKTVAGLVLENDRFDLLPLVLDEGRTVVHNVRRAARLFLLKNVYTLILIVVLVGILREAFPYLPQQVTLLNALTIGGPVLLLLIGKAPPGVAVRPAFLPEIARFVFGMGLPIGIAGLLVWQTGAGVEEKRTLLLTTLILAGLVVVLITGEGDHRLTAWVCFALLVYFVLMSIAPLAYFFALTPLNRVQWATAMAAALLAVSIGQLTISVYSRWFVGR